MAELCRSGGVGCTYRPHSGISASSSSLSSPLVSAARMWHLVAPTYSSSALSLSQSQLRRQIGMVGSIIQCQWSSRGGMFWNGMRRRKLLQLVQALSNADYPVQMYACQFEHHVNLFQSPNSFQRPKIFPSIPCIALSDVALKSAGCTIRDSPLRHSEQHTLSPTHKHTWEKKVSIDSVVGRRQGNAISRRSNEHQRFAPVLRVMSDWKSASLSAQTFRPPVHTPERSPTSGWVAAGVAVSVVLWIVYLIVRSEQYARQQLVTPEESYMTPPPPPEMVERYERAKASVAQAAMVNSALAAVRTNDLIKCAVEVELALEENRVARSSIEPDFYEDGEVLQLYQATLKVWLDGYPLDYGKLLQLRSLLAISNEDAEKLEEEVQSQSDVYVI